MNKELTVEFLNKVIFYLRMLKRVASDTDNQYLLNEVHVASVEAEILRERLFLEFEEKQ